MAFTMDRAEIRRTLEILYPDEHEVIELDVLLRGGGILPGHFDDREKLLDEIEKYDGRADVAAIYTALNRIGPKAFERPEHVIKLDNMVAKGNRIDAKDVERVTGILFDLDPIRQHGNQKDSTTDAEHQLGLDAAEFIKRRLSLMGWPDPVMGSSGNGAALRYITDLPASPETEGLLRRLFQAANSLLPKDLKGVEVDGAMFDRPRISKVFGTMTRKGDGTAERPHRRAKLISAPEKMAPVQIDSIMKLINADRKTDTQECDSPRPIEPSDAREKVLSEVENDPDIKPCLKQIILNKNIRELEEVSAHEHKGRVAIANEMIINGYSDEALHEFFSRLADYDKAKTTTQLNQIINKFASEGGKTWLCRTLRYAGVIPKDTCKGCEWVGHGQDPDKVLCYKIISDPNVLNEEAVIRALAIIKMESRIDFDLFLAKIKAAKIDVKISTIEDVVDRYIAATAKGKSDQPIDESISKEAAEIIAAGKAYEYIYGVWQKRVKGNEFLGRALLLSRGVQSCLNTKGVHVYAHGKHGHGKSEGMEKMIELFPPEFRMDEDVSPLAIHYASQKGTLQAATTLLIDEMIWTDSLAGIIKRIITRFQKGAGHLTVIDGDSVMVKTKPRLTIWTNSADLQADEQLRDRFLDEPIEEGPTSTEEIMNFQKERDTLPIPPEQTETETLICQQIIRDLANRTFMVKIPYAKLIEINTSEGTRGYNIFGDLIIVFNSTFLT